MRVVTIPNWHSAAPLGPLYLSNSGFDAFLPLQPPRAAPRAVCQRLIALGAPRSFPVTSGGQRCLIVFSSLRPEETSVASLGRRLTSVAQEAAFAKLWQKAEALPEEPVIRLFQCNPSDPLVLHGHATPVGTRSLQSVLGNSTDSQNVEQIPSRLCDTSPIKNWVLPSNNIATETFPPQEQSRDEFEHEMEAASGTRIDDACIRNTGSQSFDAAGFGFQASGIEVMVPERVSPVHYVHGMTQECGNHYSDVQPDAESRGLYLSHAAGSIKGGSVLLSVPLHVALMVPLMAPASGVTPYGTPAPAALAAEFLKHTEPPNPTDASKDCSTRDLQRGAVWREYAHLLPTEISTPADWEAEDVGRLECEEALEAAEGSREEQQRLAALIAEAAGVPLARALWALRVVLSRSFTVHAPPAAPSVVEAAPREESRMGAKSGMHQQQQQQEGQSAWFQMLVPLVDMANHAPVGPRTGAAAGPTSSALWRIAQGPTPPAPSLGGSDPEAALRSCRMQLLARRDLQPGDELTISYGPHSSLTFLLSFGFTPSYNPHARVMLYPTLQAMMDDVDERVMLQRQKEELLLSVARPDRPLVAYAGGFADWAFGCLLILHASSHEEMEALALELRLHGTCRLSPLAPATRSAAACQLSRRCEEMLSQRSTSLEEDAAELGRWDASLDATKRKISCAEPIRRVLQALQYRIESKRILTGCRDRYMEPAA